MYTCYKGVPIELKKDNYYEFKKKKKKTLWKYYYYFTTVPIEIIGRVYVKKKKPLFYTLTSYLNYTVGFVKI